MINKENALEELEHVNPRRSPMTIRETYIYIYIYIYNKNMQLKTRVQPDCN